MAADWPTQVEDDQPREERRLGERNSDLGNRKSISSLSYSTSSSSSLSSPPLFTSSLPLSTSPLLPGRTRVMRSSSSMSRLSCCSAESGSGLQEESM
jgi:hypothetical protein